MASTLSTATLTTTITEAVTINGKDQGGTNTVTTANVAHTDKRLIKVPTAAEVALIAFGAAVASGQFVDAAIAYFRFTNKDDTNWVRLRCEQTGADVFDVKVMPGQSFIISSQDMFADAAGAGFGAFVTMDEIRVHANTADCDCEYFIATI